MLIAAYSLCAIASFICAVITLIKLFKEKGLLHGLLGIVCWLYAFIWGWINVKKHNSMGVMLGWTAAVAGTTICGILYAAQMAKQTA
ncbi:MAG: hypothetical protein EPO68_00745 [Planctomycetota bacterium]|nr:MAG: hypothetical protein EPO68_00745 [Planctomycetota bacterium]